MGGYADGGVGWRKIRQTLQERGISHMVQFFRTGSECGRRFRTRGKMRRPLHPCGTPKLPGRRDVDQNTKCSNSEFYTTLGVDPRRRPVHGLVYCQMLLVQRAAREERSSCPGLQPRKKSAIGPSKESQAFRRGTTKGNLNVQLRFSSRHQNWHKQRPPRK